jgi:glycosyltransferase involved in cell wall biosynthesis
MSTSMTTFPRISVVTSSYNQGAFIGRTIESVLSQDYPDVEHIVVDGMSSDETPAVLGRYPHLRVLREPDRGQAEAINKGFRLATGDILCFLNSDDTLLPGALHRVARELDPARGRHVVMGRCPFIDEHDNLLGVEHPSAFLGHERVLKVWLGHWVPQPATFWTAEAWRRCGPLDEGEQFVLDYDFMCRLSRHYAFACVDEVLATYRLHTHSKTCGRSEEWIAEQSLRVSRRYWGHPLGLKYWRLRGSLAAHRRRQRAEGLLARASEVRHSGGRWRALGLLARAALLGPEVVARTAVSKIARLSGRPACHGAAELRSGGRLSPNTLAWRNFTAAHPDGYVGPTFVTTIRVEAADRALRLEGDPVSRHAREPLDLVVSIDDRPLAREHLPEGPPFSLIVPLSGVAEGPHTVAVSSSSFTVPHELAHNKDYRPLAFRLRGPYLEGRAGEASRGRVPVERPAA